MFGSGRGGGARPADNSQLGRTLLSVMMMMMLLLLMMMMMFRPSGLNFEDLRV